MKLSRFCLPASLAIATLSLALPVKADSVMARCEVYPQGSDRVSWSGPCIFSQRQGFVSIQLQGSKRYDLRPVGDQPGNYLDQQGQAAYRQTRLGPRGHIYLLATESVYVYWNPPAATNPPAAIAQRGISTLRSNDPEARINVRSQPTVRSSSPHYGLPGDKIKVLNCVQDQDTPGSDLNWCNVQFVESQATGWIRSDFIIFADGGE